jgi:MYXO-CTERM domain-containing protein
MAERIQLHGVFWSYSWVSDPEYTCDPEKVVPGTSGFTCRTAPTEGYVYLWCDPAVEVLTADGWQPITLERCVSDWQALVELNDQTGCVGFGESFMKEPFGADKMVEPIRAPGTPAVAPDSYHAYGLGNPSLLTTCEDADQATPPVCGDGVHHAGEWCDGNCYPDSGEECHSGGPALQVESGSNCGCGAFEPVGTAAACDRRCQDKRLSSGTDGDGCCSSHLKTYCDGGCCLLPEMSPSGIDSDCVPGAFIEVTCHQNADCGGGATCVHPNTIQSYCSGEGEPEPIDAGSSGNDATSNTGDAEPSVEPETDPTDVPVEDTTTPPGSAGNSSGGCDVGEGNSDGPGPWLLILVLALAAVQRRGAGRVTSSSPS